MKLFIKYDINAICRKLLQEQLDGIGAKYSITSLNELEIEEPFSGVKLKQLNHALQNWSIEIVEGQ